MKKLLMAMACIVAISGAAFADTMANAHENTIVVTTAQGAQVRYHFNADGSYAMTAPDGQSIAGTYAVADDQICMTPAGGEAECAPYVGDKNVGDSWTQTGADGSEISVTLEAGR
jgi:hypothetical protein